MNFKVNKSEIIHRGKVFDLQVDEIEYESGNRGIREIALHNGGAVVVPVTDEGKIVMVTQYRYPFEKHLLELPAGKLGKDEDPLECASRELTEETGYTSKDIIKLGEIYTTPGFCTEVLYIYLASGLTPGNHNREEGEFGMQILELYPDEIKNKIITGEIVDAKTICGMYYFSNLSLMKKKIFNNL